MKGRDIVFALRDALVAREQRAPDAGARADTLYQLLASVPWQAPPGEPNALLAFDLLVRHLEALGPKKIFEPAMLAGEVLAACTLTLRLHAALIERWAERALPGPRLAAMRACSKLCEYDTTLIDEAMLTALAERDDLDPTTLDYLSQVAGRLRGEDKGVALIEALSRLNEQRRLVAAHAITYSVAMDAPFATLSVFERFGPSRLVSGPPSRRLLRLLAGLMDDPSPEVAQAATQATGVARVAWPEMNALLATLLLESRGLPQAAPSAAAAVHPRAVDFALHMPSRMAKRYGKLTWDPELVEEERADAKAGTSLPRAFAAPRLFFSYRWSNDPRSDLVPDETAGRLHMSGYDLIFDRDPRHLDAGRSAEDVLRLMQDCTHFVACITDDLCRYFASADRVPKDALDLEWELAQELATAQGGRLQPMALWFDGEPLPTSTQGWPVIDLREAAFDALDALFPSCLFEVHAFDASDKPIFRSKSLKRRALRAAYLKATARPRSARVEIHDVTHRPQLDALFSGNRAEGPPPTRHKSQ